MTAMTGASLGERARTALRRGFLFTGVKYRDARPARLRRCRHRDGGATTFRECDTVSASAERRPHVAGRDGLGAALRRVAPIAFLGVMPLAVLALATASAIHNGNIGVDFRGEIYPEAKLMIHG